MFIVYAITQEGARKRVKKPIKELYVAEIVRDALRYRHPEWKVEIVQDVADVYAPKKEQPVVGAMLN